MPIGIRHSSARKSTEWLTPPEIFQAIGLFDLDLRAPMHRPWDTARQHPTVWDDGLNQPWIGRTWLDVQTWKWMCRMTSHGILAKKG